jgi:protein TonB
MMNEPTPAGGMDNIFETANDRFKRSFGVTFWGSMILATIVHVAIMAYFPELEAADVSFSMAEIEAIELPPEIEIPPPPDAIARPANPVVTSAAIDTNVTIAPTTFESNPIEELPPPPTDAVEIDVSAQPTFTPYEVAPEITNRRVVQTALVREYPAVLRDAGVGGTVLMHFFIDATGSLENVLVADGSGFEQLDAAAMRVAEVFEFSPALNRDQRVPVWIQVPITFTTN